MNSEMDRIAKERWESKEARFIPLGKVGHTSLGKWDGFGFCHSDVCPNSECEYYKYAGSYRPTPVCTHPEVIWFVEIGGVHRCPKLGRKL